LLQDWARLDGSIMNLMSGFADKAKVISHIILLRISPLPFLRHFSRAIRSYQAK
jgi:hypothetical protein